MHQGKAHEVQAICIILSMRPGCKSRRMQTIGTSFLIMSLQERHLQTCREVAAHAAVFD